MTQSGLEPRTSHTEGEHSTTKPTGGTRMRKSKLSTFRAKALRQELAFVMLTNCEGLESRQPVHEREQISPLFKLRLPAQELVGL